MNMKKKMKRFAKILVASLVVAGFCPTGIPAPVNSVVEVQAATKAKVPTCAAKQTVRVVGAFGGPNGNGGAKTILDIPECYIFIRNLSSNAKITNIKSSNKKIKATKREGLNALELSSTLMPMPFDETDLAGASSTISFRVTQNGKQYKLSCKIKVAEKKSPFSKLTVGSKNYASYFNGYMYVNEKPMKGKKKIYVKMAPGYVLDSIDMLSSKNGKYTNKKIKNGSTVNLTSCNQISVSYHTTKKPVNYKAPSKWFGQVESPLHNYNSLIFQ